LLLNHGCHLINEVLLLLNLELICLHHDDITNLSAPASSQSCR
jgi:hypothetical protein